MGNILSFSILLTKDVLSFKEIIFLKYVANVTVKIHKKYRKRKSKEDECFLDSLKIANR